MEPVFLVMPSPNAGDSPWRSSAVLLFRTHQFDAPTREFCEQLQRESGLELVCVVDESRGVLDVGGLPKISVSKPALQALGLHCPHGFQWRCGDYGLYLAAQAYPEVRHFWIVEYDVRIRRPGPLSDFFSGFADDVSDLIAPYFGERRLDWWWYPTMTSGAKPVFGCLFPMLRVSAQLARAGLEGRRRIGKSPIYRLFWPNDESFLATEAMRRGLLCRDLSGPGGELYSQTSFTFDAPQSGEALEKAELDGLIHHPVLYGAQYERKRTRIEKPTRLRERAQRKLRLALAFLG